MSSATGLAFAAALLLVAAGAAKAVRPASLVSALGVVGLPRSRHLVRAVSVGEVLLGVAALAAGSAALWLLVALAYAGFAGFVLLVRRRGDALASCGCFGGERSPATRLHVVLTLGLSLAAALEATGPAAAGAHVALLAPGALVAWLVQLCLGLLPATRAAALRGRPRAA